MRDTLWNARRKWYDIGVCFNINIPDLQVIDEENDVNTKFRKMIIKWLEKGVNCTWRMICDVLRHPTVDMNGLAKDIGMIIYKIICL